MSTRGERLVELMNRPENIAKKKNTIYLARISGRTSQYISKLKTDNIKTADPIALKIIAEDLGSTYEYLEFGQETEKILFTEPNIFNHLPKDLQEFILNEESTPYIILAKQLAHYDLSKITDSDINYLIGFLKYHIEKQQNK